MESAATPFRSRLAVEPLRVLLVEDDAADAELMHHHLEAAMLGPLDVRTVSSIAEAGAALDHDEYDLALLDLTLPDSRGADTAAALREVAPTGLPILVVTGLGDAHIEAACVEPPAQGFVRKGDLDPERLGDGIREALRYSRVAIERQRRIRDRSFQQLIDDSRDAVLVVGADATVLYANAAAEDLLGSNDDTLVGSPLAFPIRPGTEQELKLANGRTVLARVVQTEWTGRTAALVTLRDLTRYERMARSLTRVTETLRAENADLMRVAHVDPLTGIPNRRGFTQALRREAQRARRTQDPVSAVLVDIDDFKEVNEAHGHALGDRALAHVAATLSACTRPTDCVARIGGDEFLVLLPDTRVAEALLIAERMRLALPEPIRGADGDAAVSITASFGVTRVPIDEMAIESILVRARESLGASKHSGKHAVHAEGAQERRLSSFVDGLRRGEGLRAVKQSVRRLADDQIVGYELLVRGPEGPFQAPDDIFRLALSQGVLGEVDQQSLRRCLRLAAGLPGKLHLNLFPSTLVQADIDELLEIIAACSGPERSFCIEVSEQNLIGDPGPLRQPIDRLRAAGHSVAIDDLGFGRSSLETLVLLEPDVVKIDKRHVGGVARSRGKRRALERLVQIAGVLQADCIAEGVEQERDLDVVRAVGIEQAQGYYWDRPS